MSAVSNPSASGMRQFWNHSIRRLEAPHYHHQNHLKLSRFAKTHTSRLFPVDLGLTMSSDTGQWSEFKYALPAAGNSVCEASPQVSLQSHTSPSNHFFPHLIYSFFLVVVLHVFPFQKQFFHQSFSISQTFQPQSGQFETSSSG